MLFSRKSKSAAAAPAALTFLADGQPDLRSLGLLLWQKRRTILGVTLGTAAIAFVAVNAITPRYRSEARLLLETRENVFLRAAADKTGIDRTTVDAEAVTSQIQVVLSRDLARDVIRKEKLADNPEFERGALSVGGAILGVLGIGRDRNTMSREERTMEAFYDHLSVQVVDKSRVIAVAFSSADPDLAARVANTTAETYLKMQQTAQQDQTRAASIWLAGEIEKMRRRVADAEEKVEQYRAKANLFVGSNNTSLPSQQLTEINSQIAAARGRKADLEARAHQLRDLIRSGQSIESSDIANSDTMRRLIEQRIVLRNQLAEQSTTLLDKHPRIKELKAQIAEIQRQIGIEGERLARQLDNDAKVASDRLQTLTASLDQVKKLASQSNSQDVELRALEREAKTQRDLLESYLAKYREATARDSINAAPPDARVISRATPATKPTYPKKLPTVLIAAFAAFALSAGFILTGALLAPAAPGVSTSIASARVAPKIDVAPPQDDSVPAIIEPVSIAEPPSARPPSPPASAAIPQPAISTLPMPKTMASVEQVARDLERAGEAGRRVTVIGTLREVGTTTAALTLARSLANHGDVVLVDLAFASPNLSILSVDPDAPGIADVVRGSASFGEIITRDQYSPVHLVATGNVGSQSEEISSSPMLVTVIEALVHSYDHVVIDAGSVGDPAIGQVAALAQRAVLVTNDPSGAATRSAAGWLANAGLDVALLVGGSQAVAA